MQESSTLFRRSLLLVGCFCFVELLLQRVDRIFKGRPLDPLTIVRQIVYSFGCALLECCCLISQLP